MTEQERARVLIVDDEPGITSSLAANLEVAGFSVRTADCGDAAIKDLQNEACSIIITDNRLPDISGLEFIKKARELSPAAGIIMMTGFGTQELALNAIRAGATDFLAKPFSIEDLVLSIKKYQERQRFVVPAAVKPPSGAKVQLSNIIAESPAMRDIFETVKRLAHFSTTVLISGESGTGKELIAQAIHLNSPRKSRPFVAINCGAIPETLIESELFGHRRGAFTDATKDKRGLFEEANGGTIFLDEVGELPLHLQVKLLRALQEQQIRRVGDEELTPIDVRVIAATLRNLEDDVATGRFRDDLYYRLNVVSINIPPLRERREDIPVLVKHFLKKHTKRLGLSVHEVTPEAYQCLTECSWRGNVRELENCIERALVLSDGDRIDVAALPVQVRGQNNQERATIADLADDNLSIKQRTQALEINLILRALKKTKGNRTHAARILELSHRALLYKLKEYNLGNPDKKSNLLEPEPEA